jgi:hypothetical protein
MIGAVPGKSEIYEITRQSFSNRELHVFKEVINHIFTPRGSARLRGSFPFVANSLCLFLNS